MDEFGRAQSQMSVVSGNQHAVSPKGKTKPKDKDISTNKRRCVSTACIACRKRKSKCDGNLPKCAACASVYLTECEYAPHTDHRRKGVYKKDTDNLKTKNSTLQILIQALLNAEDEEDAFDLVRQIRSCDNLEDLAQAVENKARGIADTPDSPIYGNDLTEIPQFEAELSGKMGDLVIDGSIKFIGGTSNLIWLNDSNGVISHSSPAAEGYVAVKPREEAILNWTAVTQDKDLILHFMNMYFCWHYAYFTTLSKELFYRDFLTGTDSQYCSPLLVNVMLALGCHFSSKPSARSNPQDSSTTGDHFFAEAKRLLHKNDEFSIPKLCTIQALALMSVREAGCGRESKGWVYSGMSFRLAADLGLNVDPISINDARRFNDEEIDARRITFWGCFLFDKCWSNYLGRQPQFLLTDHNVKKPDVFGVEDSEQWSPYTDAGVVHAHTQPARTRAVALQISKLAEVSSDLLSSFYQPQHSEKPNTKQNELKKLTDIHTRLETWKRELPSEMEAKDGQLPQVILMHMFYQLLYIHLYRPFLRYTKATSPLPNHVSPRKFCTQAAGAISKLFRLYKRTHGLRQICNIAVYIAHSACTIHLLNLPDKNAIRDIIHGVKQLEEIGEYWSCARRTLRILGLCADKWKIDLPEEAQAVIQREHQRWSDNGSGSSSSALSPIAMATIIQQMQSQPALDMLTQNFQQHQRMRHYSGSEGSYASMSTPSLTPNDPVRSIADSVEKSQNIHPLLPQGPEDNNPTRSKFSLHLTQEQQDAWNALQAKMGYLTPGGAKTTNEQPLNAATMFGGVDSLIEESQDWWYQDQSQLALGFDNWTSPPSDWAHMGGSSGVGMMMNSDPTIQMPTNQSHATFSSPQNGMGHIMPPTTSAMAGFTQLPKQHHPTQNMSNQYNSQTIGQTSRQPSTSSVSPPAHRLSQYQPMVSTAQKRSSTYDDDDDIYG